MSNDKIREFANGKLAHFLIKAKVRKHFLDQCYEYVQLRKEHPNRPPPAPFEKNDDSDIQELEEPSLELCEKYAVLTAVHDAFRSKAVKHVFPTWSEEEVKNEGPEEEGPEEEVKNEGPEEEGPEEEDCFWKGEDFLNHIIWNALLSNVKKLTDESLGDLEICLLEVESDLGAMENISPTETDVGTRETKTKRSTEKGEARDKINAALTQHHQYSKGSCLNPEPIGVRKLANKADVSQSTVSDFFKKEFRGHSRYKSQCANGTLITSLKLLNGEFSPHIFTGNPDLIPGNDNSQEQGFEDE